MKQMERGARVRLKHKMELLDGHVAALKSCIEADLPTSGNREGLIQAAYAVAEQLAIIDAYRFERESGAA